MIPLFAGFNAAAILSAAHNAITHTGQIANSPAAHEYNAVFLNAMSFSRNEASSFSSIVQLNAGIMPLSRVWFLRVHDPCMQYNPLCKRVTLQRTRLGLPALWYAWFAYQLVYRGQLYSLVAAAGVSRLTFRLLGFSSAAAGLTFVADGRRYKLSVDDDMHNPSAQVRNSVRRFSAVRIIGTMFLAVSWIGFSRIADRRQHVRILAPVQSSDMLIRSFIAGGLVTPYILV